MGSFETHGLSLRDQTGPERSQNALWLGAEISRMNQCFSGACQSRQSSHVTPEERPEAMACKSGFGSQPSRLGNRAANMKDEAGDL